MLSFPRPLAAALLALAACHAPSSLAAGSEAGQAESAERIPLNIATANGVKHYRVEIARTQEEQARGLMFRTALPPDGGMLFPLESERPASFWMKNTPLPLDIIFIRSDGTIARIAEQTVPYSLDLIDSGEPVTAVLELAGGTAAVAGIAEGDKVEWADPSAARP